MSALNDARLETPGVPDRSPGRYAGPRFALALLVVVALGTLAVRLSLPETTGDIRPTRTPAILTGFDALRLRLQNIENTWEAPLRTEASLLAEDARSAGRYVLASLPLPASWQAD